MSQARISEGQARPQRPVYARTAYGSVYNLPSMLTTLSTASTTATDLSIDTSGQSGSGQSSSTFGTSGRRGVRQICPMSFHEMIQRTKQLQHDTLWLRVVQVGYGQKLWRQLVKGRGLFLVDALSAAEGTYVQIPPRFAVEQIMKGCFPYKLHLSIIRHRAAMFSSRK